MKTGKIYILTMILVVLTSVQAFSQDKGKNTSKADSYLNQYEQLCRNCMEIKQLISEQGSVLLAKATEAISEFLKMNKIIKKNIEKLSTKQKNRYEMINYWFATGVEPMALTNNIELAALSTTAQGIKGKNQRIKTAINQDTLPISQMRSRLILERSHQIHTPIRWHFLITGSYPLAYGIKAGVMHNKWGGYLSANSNFIFNKHSYTCTHNGMMDNGYSFWGTGKTRFSNLMVTAGGLYSISEHWNIFLGAGYGENSKYWEDIDKKWAKVLDVSHSGFSMEAGFLSSYGKFAFSAGITTINFKTIGFEIGIGFKLEK